MGEIGRNITFPQKQTMRIAMKTITPIFPRHRIFFFTAFFFAFLTCFSLYADIIHLKTGKKIEGILRESTNGNVVIETAGGVFSFPEDAIERVEKGTPFMNLLARAHVEDVRENYIAAVRYYAEALKLANTSAEKNSVIIQQKSVIQKYIAALDQHDPLVQGLDDIQQIEEVKRLISDADILSRLQGAKLKLEKTVVQKHIEEGQRQRNRNDYEKAIEHYEVILTHYPNHLLARDLPEKVTNLYIEWGELVLLRSRDRQSPEAKQLFIKAIELSPNNSRAMYHLGLIELYEKNYSDAVLYLKDIDETVLTANEKKRLRIALAQAQSALIPSVKEQPKTRYIPAPAPTPVPSTTDKVTNWFRGAWGGTQRFFSNLFSGKVDTSSFDIIWVWIILGVVLAVLLLWYLPLKIVVRDLPNRQVVYSDWKKIVSYSGIFGLIFYYIGRWRTQESKLVCSSCGRSIDDPAFFENLNFEECPFCKAPVKTPYTLPGLIESRSESMAKSKEFAGAYLDESHQHQLIDLLNYILIQGIRIRANEIEITAQENSASIQYQIDGVQTESITFHQGMLKPLINAVKQLCKMNPTEAEFTQDGFFSRLLLGEQINVRASILPGDKRESLAMRLIDEKMASITLDRLGIREELLDPLQTLLRAPNGLILTAGPRGSGRTTLQYACLNFLNNGTRKIATIEAPIEYELKNINQNSFRASGGLPYASVVNSVMQHEPDIVMAGELKDLDTASLIFDASASHYTFLAGLDAADAIGAIHRLYDTGFNRETIGAALLGIVSSRLVRKLCPHCKKQSSPTSNELQQLGEEALLLEGQPIFRPRGCKECFNTGYLGRTGFYELLIIKENIRDLIVEGAGLSTIHKAIQNSDQKTLREEGIMKALSGATSVEEVIRVTYDVYTTESH